MAEFPRRYSIYFADLNPTVGAEIQKVRSAAASGRRSPSATAPSRSSRLSAPTRSSIGPRRSSGVG